MLYVKELQEFALALKELKEKNPTKFYELKRILKEMKAGKDK